MTSLLENAYTTLVEYCKNREDTSKPGLGGMWTAESNKGDEIARHQMYDGGYTGVVMSKKYGFSILFAYLNDQGNTYKLGSGTEDSVRECMRYCQELCNPSADVEVKIKHKN